MTSWFVGFPINDRWIVCPQSYDLCNKDFIMRSIVVHIVLVDGDKLINLILVWVVFKLILVTWTLGFNFYFLDYWVILDVLFFSRNLWISLFLFLILTLRFDLFCDFHKVAISDLPLILLLWDIDGLSSIINRLSSKVPWNL